MGALSKPDERGHGDNQALLFRIQGTNTFSWPMVTPTSRFKYCDVVVAAAFLNAGWPVRALVRDPQSPGSIALGDAGGELIAGGFDDHAALDAAMTGAYSVFSVQPSSPAGPCRTKTKSATDFAVTHGVTHLVYSSGSAAGDKPTGIRFRSRMRRIEASCFS